MSLRRFLYIFLLAFSCVAFAQVSSDPLDFFYTDLAIWETSGLINNVPASRPYPLQLVKEMLKVVIENGDAVQREIAEAHYRRFFGRIVAFGGKAEGAIDTASLGKQMGVALSLDINAEIEEYFTLSGSVDGWATNKLPSMEIAPAWVMSQKDIIEDNARVGSLWVLPSINSSVAIGTTEYYLNAGMMRGSYGPFHDNGVIVGPQALHSGQYSLAINKPQWGYNFSLFSLTAADIKDNWYPEKYLSVHSFEYRPFSWLSVSLLESVMYGGRLEPMYFLPLSSYMISQGQTGFSDNCYLGGMFTVKPVQGLKIDGVFYADDLSFNDIARFHFETKWQLAGQLGASFTPKKSGKFALASFDYTMITPYTYAHKESTSLEGDMPNYQNYKHGNESFGASLNPNSDRINLKMKIRPLEAVDVDFIGTLIRHGNVNETIGYTYVKKYVTNDIYSTDGSILNSARVIGEGHAYQDSTPFLTQDTIQYITQTGFNVLCRLPVLQTGGSIVFRFGYRFECNINDGINRQLYRYDDETLQYDNDGKVTSTDAQIREIASEQLASWRDAAKGIDFNNYISAGFEFYY